MHSDLCLECAGLSQQRPAFISRPVHVGFLVGKVALGHVSLRVLRLYPVSIIPTALYAYSVTQR
jgi:hypothetical protein